MPNSSAFSYNQLGTVITVIVSNLIAVALAKGIITASTASALNNEVAIIGAIILALVMNAALVIGNQWHRLRYGPVPQFPAPAPATVTPLGSPLGSPPAVPSPPSPSYAPASTGPIPAPPADVPLEAV